MLRRPDESLDHWKVRAALAYRVRTWAGQRGWDCTISDAAEALDSTVGMVTGVARRMGWLNRFRVTGATQEDRGFVDPVFAFHAHGIRVSDVATGSPVFAE